MLAPSGRVGPSGSAYRETGLGGGRCTEDVFLAGPHGWRAALGGRTRPVCPSPARPWVPTRRRSDASLSPPAKRGNGPIRKARPCCGAHAWAIRNLGSGHDLRSSVTYPPVLEPADQPPGRAVGVSPRRAHGPRTGLRSCRAGTPTRRDLAREPSSTLSWPEGRTARARCRHGHARDARPGRETGTPLAVEWDRSTGTPRVEGQAACCSPSRPSPSGPSAPRR